MTPRFQYLTIKEYADLKRVTERTVHRWIRARKIHAERTIEPDGRWRIRRAVEESSDGGMTLG